uniref:Uncharacterized protein n=1 Tax=Rhizophora mucronata TaxID=61149 RepID=A0A2P2IHU5_RHIMU
MGAHGGLCLSGIAPQPSKAGRLCSLTCLHFQQKLRGVYL